jgi:hypothetical protein
MNYFDGLRSRVDEKAELYIRDNRHNQTRVDRVNAAREKWIVEIKECLEFNIAQCAPDEEDELRLQDDLELFKKFCFIFEFYADVLSSGCFTWRFVSTDTYLRPGQIACFEELLKFSNTNGAHSFNCPKRLFFGIKTESQVFKKVILEIKKNYTIFKL